jgi:hypothetical protein
LLVGKGRQIQKMTKAGECRPYINKSISGRQRSANVFKKSPERPKKVEQKGWQRLAQFQVGKSSKSPPHTVTTTGKMGKGRTIEAAKRKVSKCWQRPASNGWQRAANKIGNLKIAKG